MRGLNFESGLTACYELLAACLSSPAERGNEGKSYSCSGRPRGCTFAIWKTIAGKRIGARTAQMLLRKGESGVLKGFKSKAGKPFEARLKVVQGEVRFDFDSA